MARVRLPELPRPNAGLVGIFAHHATAANLLMVLLILFGLFGAVRINSQFFPTIESQFISVRMAWSGASAEDVESNILAIVEPAVRFLDGVENVASTAREGSASVTINFRPNTDMRKAQADVEQAIDTLTLLPQDADAPRYGRSRFFDRVARLSITGPFSESALRTYAKRIRDDLLARGIEKINISGLRPEEVLINVSDRELRRLDLSVRDISNKISSNSLDRPSGKLDGSVEKQVRTLATASDPDRLGDIDIKTLPSGESIALDQIADVRRGFEEGAPIGLVDNKPAIQLTVMRTPGSDTLETAAIFKDYLTEIGDRYPASLKVTTYDVRADSLWQRIMLLVKNGLGGLAIVLVVLFLFLNARIAFWVAAGIPVAFMATIGVMYFTGQTINMISLFALIMTLGIVVDDAIVVGEHTDTRMQMGDSPLDAAINGAGRMISPVMAASLTTVASFLPILLIGDTIGQIMQTLPQVVVAVLIASLVECFLILPGHLAHSLGHQRKRAWSFWRQFFLALMLVVALSVLAFRPEAQLPPVIAGIAGPLQQLISEQAFVIQALAIAAVSFLGSVVLEALVIGILKLFKGKSGQPGWFRSGFDAGFAWLRDGPFRWLVTLTYDWRWSTVALAVATLILAIGFYSGGRVGFVFFPSPEAEEIRARIIFHAGVPEQEIIGAIQKIDASLRKVDAELAGDQGSLISSTYVTVGESRGQQNSTLATMNVHLVPSEARDVRTIDIVSAWRRAVPKLAVMRRFAIARQRAGPPGRDIDVLLKNQPPAVLKQAAGEVIELLENYPGVSGVSDDLPYGKPEIVMRLTARGAALGFSIDEVGRQVRAAFEGVVPRRIALQDDELTIRVRRISDREGAAQLRDLELKSPAGGFVPLSEVVAVQERQGFSRIRRYNGKTTISISADVDTEVTSIEDTVASLNSGPVAAIAAKYDAEFEFSGKDEERREAFADLWVGVLLAISIIFIILAWVFGSYFQPLLVMCIIPFGIVGAIFGHFLLGYPLTIFSFIGLLGLAGILVNDSIILVSRMNERLETGEAARFAAIGASCDRLRAVILTSLTTIGGLTPLLFETSRQAQFLIPMAITIVFGIATATAFVLVLVPALVGVGSDVKRLFTAIWGSRRDVQPAG